MKIQVKIIVLLMFLFVLAMAGCGSSGGDGAGAGGGDIPGDLPTVTPTDTPTGMPTCTPAVDYYIHLKGTTYNMQDAIIDVKEQVVNLALKDKLPSQLNAYETFAGVQIEMLLNVPQLLKDILLQIGLGIIQPDADFGSLFNLDGIMGQVMGSIKQTPLLLQFWALDQMKSSVNPGKDGVWFTSDDTIDSIYGYFDTVKKADGTYEQKVYSDFGKTLKGRVVYTLNADGLKTMAVNYDAQGNLVRTTKFKYNADKQMTEAINRDAQDIVESDYRFTYNSDGLLTGMRSYESRLENAKLLGGGSYTTLEWSENNSRLVLTLGLQVNAEWVLKLLGLNVNLPGLIKPIDLRFLTTKYRFSTVDPKVITKSTEYGMLKKPEEKNVDTIYRYFYDGNCAAMSGGTTYDWSQNFDKINGVEVQKSTTENELSIELREVPGSCPIADLL